MVRKPRTKKRRDHYLPQGYLRGFIDPARAEEDKPLWHFDVTSKEWSEKSTSEVGFGYGFYDYAGNPTGVEAADETFARLEREYPQVRARLVANGFSNWRADLDQILAFMQMLRARSPLFFKQQDEAGRSIQAYKVVEILPDGKTLKVDGPFPLPDAARRNKALAEMRAEIQKEAAWMKEFDWALRYTESPLDPVITVDQPVLLSGPAPSLEAAWRHPDTLIHFPLCWQACLFGSRLRFDVETASFLPEDIKRLRSRFRESADVFLVSPSRIDNW